MQDGLRLFAVTKGDVAHLKLGEVNGAGGLAILGLKAGVGLVLIDIVNAVEVALHGLQLTAGHQQGREGTREASHQGLEGEHATQGQVIGDDFISPNGEDENAAQPRQEGGEHVEHGGKVLEAQLLLVHLGQLPCPLLEDVVLAPCGTQVFHHLHPRHQGGEQLRVSHEQALIEYLPNFVDDEEEENFQ